MILHPSVRSLLATLAGAVAYPALCVSVGWILAALFPDLFRLGAAPPRIGLLGLLLALNGAGAFTAGFAAGTVARDRIFPHALVLSAVNLGLAAAVLVRFGESLPIGWRVGLLLPVVPCHLWGAALAELRFERRGLA